MTPALFVGVSVGVEDKDRYGSVLRRFRGGEAARLLSIVKDDLEGSGGGGAIVEDSVVGLRNVRCVEDDTEREVDVARSAEEGGTSTKTRRLACDFWVCAGMGAEMLSVGRSCVRTLSTTETLRPL